MGNHDSSRYERKKKYKLKERIKISKKIKENILNDFN